MPVAVILSLAFLLVLLLHAGRNGIGSFWFIELSSIFSCDPVLWCSLLLIFKSQIIYKTRDASVTVTYFVSLFHIALTSYQANYPSVIHFDFDCCFLLSVSTILSLINNICYLCVDVYCLRKYFGSSFAVLCSEIIFRSEWMILSAIIILLNFNQFAKIAVQVSLLCILYNPYLRFSPFYFSFLLAKSILWLLWID